ncbi:MerR family DNA-binding transcriptional regulator [Oricola cellulosilytica]|uniref:MerR family DNA-binding transcriptional regulator n=2 Tax=Oricola cellulosilytica TaxID=1429082 RepID=A0A4R0PFC6_9HYPH|nr:MerR family DNA-binding transcriptional regulator [Oricola cellulosilytica]
MKLRRSPGANGNEMMNTVTTSNNLEDHEITYRIGELSSEFDVTLRTLRFYEDKELLFPKRVGNTRLYSRADRARLKLILLGKRVGLSLQDVKELLSLYDAKGDNRRQLGAAVQKGEQQMSVLVRQRESVEKAIAELNDTLGKLRSLIAEKEK